MKKFRALVALSLVCMTVLSGCSLVDTLVGIIDEKAKENHEQLNPTPTPTPVPTPEPGPSVTPDPTPNPDPTPDPDPKPDPGPSVTPDPTPVDPDQAIFQQEGTVNPLTGLAGIREETLDRVPVAIMIGNSRDALPQWGVADADILVEMLAEGSITRLMGIYKDPYEVEAIASIRSARPYFIDIAQSFGAAYLHFGGSTPAYEAFAARPELIHIDGVTGSWEGTLYYRDAGRRTTVGSVHSVTTTGKLIEAALTLINKDLSLGGTQPSAFRFSDKVSNKSCAEGGSAANKITINYSNTNKPWFEFNAVTGEYLRYQYSAAHMDGQTNQQVSVKNLFVLRMDTNNVPGDSLGIIEIETTGTGTGYYFCDGQQMEIVWSKESHNSPLNFYDKDGNPLVLARGNSFISVVKTTTNVTIQ